MNRRALLTILSGSLVGAAGCSSDTDFSSASSETEPGTATSSSQSSTETQTTDQSLDVTFRKAQYVVNAYEPASGRGIDPENIVAEQDIPPALREALREARENGFETDTASTELLAAIDEFRTHASGELKPYVELDGTTYEFDPTVPTSVIELEEKIFDEYDTDRLFRAENQVATESEAVEEFVRALIADGTHVPRSTYKRCVVPDAVTAFLEDYDYIQDQRGVSRITTSVRNEDPPYTITVTELTLEDLWGDPVVEKATLDAELVAFFERVLNSTHRKPALGSPNRWQYFTNEVPDSYTDIATEYERPPYFQLNGTVYRIVAGQPNYDGLPVSVSVDVVDATDRTFTLTASPKLESDAGDGRIEGPFRFTSQGALPSALWIVHDGERVLLNSELERAPSSEVSETVGVDASVTASCSVPDALAAGEYITRGQFSVSWSIAGQTPDEHGLFPFQLVITITED